MNVLLIGCGACHPNCHLNVLSFFSFSSLDFADVEEVLQLMSQIPPLTSF